MFTLLYILTQFGFTKFYTKKPFKIIKKYFKNTKVQKKHADIIYVIAEKLKIPDAQVYIRADGKYYFNQPLRQE